MSGRVKSEEQVMGEKTSFIVSFIRLRGFLKILVPKLSVCCRPVAAFLMETALNKDGGIEDILISQCSSSIAEFLRLEKILQIQFLLLKKETVTLTSMQIWD